MSAAGPLKQSYPRQEIQYFRSELVFCQLALCYDIFEVVYCLLSSVNQFVLALPMDCVYFT